MDENVFHGRNCVLQDDSLWSALQLFTRPRTLSCWSTDMFLTLL